MNNNTNRCYPYESGYLASALRSIVWEAHMAGLTIKDEAKLEKWIEAKIKDAIDGGRKML